MRPLVVIPTYNEIENITTVLGLALDAAPDADVLVVDDSSPDGTADAVRAHPAVGARVHLLVRAEKSGLGAAYRAGFAWGRAQGYDVLIEMDADLSHDPHDLPRLLGAIADGADLAIGSRYVPGGSIPDWAWHRKLLSDWGNRYTRGMLGLGVRDTTAGFRAYRGALLDRLDLDAIGAEGYGFQIEMTYRSVQAGAAITEIPIAFTDRTEGTSKMSSRIIVEALALVARWGIGDLVRGRRIRA